MQRKATTGLNRTATGLLQQKCEPWIRHTLVQGDVERSASSCYQLCSGESFGRPWWSQLDLYEYFHRTGRGCGDALLIGPWLLCSSWCVRARRDLVGQQSITASTVKTIICPLPFSPSSSPETLRCKATAFLIQKYEPHLTLSPLKVSGELEIDPP